MTLKPIEELKKLIKGAEEAPNEDLNKNTDIKTEEVKKDEEPLEKSVEVPKEEPKAQPAIDSISFMEKSTEILETLSKNLEVLDSKNNEALKNIVTSLEDLSKSLEDKVKKADELEKSVADVMKRLDALEKTPNVKKSAVVEKNFEGNNPNEKKLTKSQGLDILRDAALKGEIPLEDLNKYEMTGKEEFLSETAKKLLIQ